MKTQKEKPGTFGYLEAIRILRKDQEQFVWAVWKLMPVNNLHAFAFQDKHQLKIGVLMLGRSIPVGFKNA